MPEPLPLEDFLRKMEEQVQELRDSLRAYLTYMELMKFPSDERRALMHPSETIIEGRNFRIFDDLDWLPEENQQEILTMRANAHVLHAQQTCLSLR